MQMKQQSSIFFPFIFANKSFKIPFIESKEIAQAAMNKAITTGTAGLSAYHKAQKKPDEQMNRSQAISQDIWG